MCINGIHTLSALMAVQPVYGSVTQETPQSSKYLIQLAEIDSMLVFLPHSAYLFSICLGPNLIRHFREPVNTVAAHQALYKCPLLAVSSFNLPGNSSGGYQLPRVKIFQRLGIMPNNQASPFWTFMASVTIMGQ